MTGVSEGSGNGRVTRCPECAWTRGAPLVPLSSWQHWTSAIPLAALTMCLAGLVAWCVWGSEVHQVGSGVSGAVVVEPGVTGKELLAVHEQPDGGRAGELLDRVLDAAGASEWQFDLPGERRVDVGYGSSEGTRRTTWRIGWPVPWCTVVESRDYRDAIARRGFLPVQTDPTLPPQTNRWEGRRFGHDVPVRPAVSFEGGDLLFRPAPEQTGGAVRETEIDPGGIAVVPAFGALVGCALSMAMHRRLNRVGPEDRRRLRRRRRAVALGAMLLLVIVGLM